MKTLIVLAVFCLLLFLFREQWLPLIGKFLIVEDALHPADVIHVIAGEEYRLDHAIRLYRQGYAKTIFLTGGGWCQYHQVDHGTDWKQRALEGGVPDENIVVDNGKITSTYNEVERLKIWMGQGLVPIRSVIVVSDPFHMRRARWTYKKVLGNSITIEMAPVPLEHTPYQRIWWRDPRSRQNIQEEYFKLLYYLLRYQYSWGIFKDWLVSIDTE